MRMSDDTGVLVSPASRERAATRGPRGPRNLRWLKWVLGVAAVVSVAVGAFVLRPWLDGGGTAGEASAAPADEPEGDPAREAALEAELVALRAELVTAQAAGQELRDARILLEAKASEADALEAKLATVVGKQGSVAQDGDEIRLQLVDKVLFRVGEAELTEKGMDVLDRIGVALNDLPDKQMWVQGHTDDSPIRPAKGVIPRFASNWELSAARALTVVHYLQDTAGVDPRRLAAVAFGEHRPASRTKAKNRRIEIVLYPRHALARE